MEDSLDLSLRDQLAGLRAQGLCAIARVLDEPQGTSVTIDGRRVINLASNNYLGLANHPRVTAAAFAALESWGGAAAAGRNIIGTMPPHLQLEAKIAGFKATQAAVLFTSGYVANVGAIPALVGEEDVIVSDELNHGSLIDACRLCKAKRLIYAHRNLQSLESILKEVRGARRVLIMTDSVFSMDGDVAPLDGISHLAASYGASLYVDDAHGTGVLGEKGRGAGEHFGLGGAIAVEMGTLSKALGAYGGFVAGSTELCEWLRQSARSYLLTTSLPPSICAAAVAAIDVLESEPQLVGKLRLNADRFRSQLKEIGFNTGASETPIIPVIVGEAKLATQMSQRLFEEGVFAQGIGYPIVARDKARLRIIVTAGHSEAELEIAIDALSKVGRELGVI